MSIADIGTGKRSTAAIMAELGRNAREAAGALALAPTKQKDAALLGAAMVIRANVDDILAANAKDLEAAGAKGLSGAMGNFGPLAGGSAPSSPNNGSSERREKPPID